MNSRFVTILLFVVFLCGSVFSQTFDPSQLAGNWRGTWYNITFASTDSAFLDVSYDGNASSITMVLDLNGNVFGGSDPAPVTLTGTYDQYSFNLTGSGAPYGNIVLTGSGAGLVYADLPNVQNSSIDSAVIAGSYNSTNIDLVYLIYFTGSSDTANGVINLVKDNATAVQATNVNPNEYRLYQNYPNPFNPTTDITFSLAQESHVQINIYNVIGEKVRTLLNDNLSAGIHQVRFNTGSNGNSLASGVYFYTIETPNYKAVKKMILMK